MKKVYKTILAKYFKQNKCMVFKLLRKCFSVIRVLNEFYGIFYTFPEFTKFYIVFNLVYSWMLPGLIQMQKNQININIFLKIFLLKFQRKSFCPAKLKIVVFRVELTSLKILAFLCVFLLTVRSRI